MFTGVYSKKSRLRRARRARYARGGNLTTLAVTIIPASVSTYIAAGVETPGAATEAACVSIRLLVAPFAHDARGVLSTSVQVGARALPLLYSTAQ